jgi:hypothetical protein
MFNSGKSMTAVYLEENLFSYPYKLYKNKNEFIRKYNLHAGLYIYVT